MGRARGVNAITGKTARRRTGTQAGPVVTRRIGDPDPTTNPPMPPTVNHTGQGYQGIRRHRS